MLDTRKDLIRSLFSTGAMDAVIEAYTPRPSLHTAKAMEKRYDVEYDYWYSDAEGNMHHGYEEDFDLDVFELNTVVQTMRRMLRSWGHVESLHLMITEA